jgi:hypothetical protein
MALKYVVNGQKYTKIFICKAFKSTYTKIGVFGLKMCHLATLDGIFKAILDTFPLRNAFDRKFRLFA